MFRREDKKLIKHQKVSCKIWKEAQQLGSLFVPFSFPRIYRLSLNWIKFKGLGISTNKSLEVRFF